jgi:hypothetical protein
VNAVTVVTRQPCIGPKPQKSILILRYCANVIRGQPMKQNERTPLVKVGGSIEAIELRRFLSVGGRTQG